MSEPEQPVREPEEPVHVGPWRRRTRRVAYENPWIRIDHDEVDRPDGSSGIYGVVHFENVAIGVVAVGGDGRLLLVGQHRYPLDRYSWEIPEGGAPLDESPEIGARRELAEETGYEAGTLRELFQFSLSNSVSDELGVIYLATDLREGIASPEPTEDLAIRWATLEQVVAEIDAGDIHDLMTIAGVTRYALEVARKA
jgi:8-oxo-dGTP pyrophosphatase MutT (NUDIX family)